MAAACIYTPWQRALWLALFPLHWFLEGLEITYMYVLYKLSVRVLQVKNDWRPFTVDEKRPSVFRYHLGVEISSLLRQDVLLLRDLIPLGAQLRRRRL